MKTPTLLLVLLSTLACGRVSSESPAETVENVMCESSHDLNGDGFADLVVPEDAVWGSGGGAPSWRASVYLGGSKGYRQPMEFRWKDGWGHNLVAYSLGDPRGLGLTDVAFYAYQQGAAEENCDPTTVLRSEGGELVTMPIGLKCPSEDAAAPGYDDSTTFGDVNGDGQDEILRWKRSGNEVTLELVSGTGDVLGAVVEVEEGGRRYVSVGDITGDGLPDAIGMNALYASTIRLTLIAGNQAGLDTPVPAGTLSLKNGRAGAATVLGDINGDGSFDFSLYSPKTPAYPQAEYVLALSTASQEFSLVSQSGSLEAAGDIDCDGRDDVVLRRTIPGGKAKLDVFHGTPSGISKRQSLVVPDAGNGSDVLPVFLPFHRRL